MQEDNKKKRWWTDGVNEKFAEECPEGWRNGRAARIGAAARERMIKNNPMHNLTEVQKQAHADKLHQYNLNKTAEQIKHKSEAISNATKGKHVGQIPWNKGKKGVQAAWNKGLTLGPSWNKGLKMSAESCAKLSQSLKGREPWNKGLILGPWDDELRKRVAEKQYITKKRNHSFSSSKPEEAFKIYLFEKYGKSDVYCQYRDERYPFACDFYIKSKDLFIELNLTWTHGGHPYDKNSPEDQLLLARWQEKAKDSAYYKNAVYVWTELDVKKHLTAKQNKLNYLCIYHMEDYHGE